MHKPVMLSEVLEALHVKAGDTVVDATLGGGGYAKALHEIVGPTGKVIAIDADAQAIARFKKNHPAVAKKVTLVHANYSALEAILEQQGISEVDAAVADLGLSSDQLASSERGFSFQEDGPLSMLYDTGSGAEDAEAIVNEWNEGDLVKMLKEFGDEKYAKRIAWAIVAAREQQRITSTGALTQIIVNAVPKAEQFKKIHPATKTFQALRIAANQEYQHLQSFLEQAIAATKIGGRIGVVTFHSGEDRIVKTVLRENARGCICPAALPVCRCNHRRRVTVLGSTGVSPTHEEVSDNPRARSARLRVAERVSD